MVEESREELVRQIGELRRKLVDLEADRVKERSASMLESIVRAVPDVIYRLDGQGRFLYVNDAVRRYGYQPEELLGHSCSSFDAVEVALREKPGLVLLDLSMNVTLGREVLDEVQARGVDAKVIASTVDWFGAEDIMGVDGVVHKPIPPDELIRQVHKVLTH